MGNNRQQPAAQIPVRNNLLCHSCPAICCTNLSIPIDKPRTKSDREDLKWHLHYDTIKVYIRNRRWYLLVEGRCMYLDTNNLCTIYSRRPEKCRRHNPPDCEYYSTYFDIMLRTPEELDEYLNNEKKRGSAGNQEK